MTAGVDLVLLWHFHQPDYRDPATGIARLPWVRLHATKDYLDFAERLKTRPRSRMTFNFVPALVDQIEAAAGGRADEVAAALSRPMAELEGETRRWLAARCLQIPPRALEDLPALRAWPAPAAARLRAGALPDDDAMRALAAAFLIAWTDPTLRGAPEIAALAAGDRRPGDADIAALLELHDRLLARVIPAWRELLAADQVELSCSPYYHPILPLLIDTDSARRARPDLVLPRIRFAHPEDATRQIARARARHARAFGREPLGLWPSEGSISPEAVACAAAEGVRWMASDEEVLFRSRGDTDRRALHRPWRWETPAGPVTLFFRDRGLSDRIGFVYAAWDPDDAVEDLLSRLRRIAAPAGEERPVVTIALDGENCWEAYAADGGPFLDRLLDALDADPQLRLRTPSDLLATAPAPALTRLHSGSWIDADFHIWLGSAEKNRAWDLLARARADLDGVADAVEPLLRAEGSDWFWWLGDDHYTADKAVYDALFRAHLRSAYAAAGRAGPADLDVPIAARGGTGAGEIDAPPLRPVVDGRVTHYYEWHGAACLRAGGGGAMHARSSCVRAVRFGFDRSSFHLRIDFEGGRPPAGAWGLRVEDAAGTTRLEVPALGSGSATVLIPAADGTLAAATAGLLAIDTILELSVPRSLLGMTPGASLVLFLRLLDAGRPAELVPDGEAVRIVVPDEDFDAGAWDP